MNIELAIEKLQREHKLILRGLSKLILLNDNSIGDGEAGKLAEELRQAAQR